MFMSYYVFKFVVLDCLSFCIYGASINSKSKATARQVSSHCITRNVAVWSLQHPSPNWKLQGHRMTLHTSYRAALSHQYGAVMCATLPLLSCLHSPLAQLFFLQRCTISMWPWRMKFGNGYYTTSGYYSDSPGFKSKPKESTILNEMLRDFP